MGTKWHTKAALLPAPSKNSESVSDWSRSPEKELIFATQHGTRHMIRARASRTPLTAAANLYVHEKRIEEGDLRKITNACVQTADIHTRTHSTHLLSEHIRDCLEWSAEEEGPQAGALYSCDSLRGAQAR